MLQKRGLCLPFGWARGLESNVSRVWTPAKPPCLSLVCRKKHVRSAPRTDTRPRWMASAVRTFAGGLWVGRGHLQCSPPNFPPVFVCRYSRPVYGYECGSRTSNDTVGEG